MIYVDPKDMTVISKWSLSPHMLAASLGVFIIRTLAESGVIEGWPSGGSNALPKKPADTDTAMLAKDTDDDQA